LIQIRAKVLTVLKKPIIKWAFFCAKGKEIGMLVSFLTVGLYFKHDYLDTD